MSALAKHWIVAIGASLCACEGSQAGLLGEFLATVKNNEGVTARESPTSSSAGSPAVATAPVTTPMPETPQAPAMTDTSSSSEQKPSYGRIQPAPGETCYELKTHASTSHVDDNPFTVSVGDSTEQFYYRAPWPNGSVATAIATISDNAEVLHRWFLWRTNEDQADGGHVPSPLPTLIGLETAAIAAWSAGGANLVPPDDIGFQLPDNGELLNLQWTYANATGEPQPDASVVQICVTSQENREHIAGVTWLGTEDLNGNEWTGGPGMPPHQMSTFTTTCQPGRAGLDARESIHIVGYQPHMNALGTNMQTAVEHTDGSTEVLIDKPFEYGETRHYYRRYELLPGESLTTSCTFNNTTNAGVPFGAVSSTEMCYQFVFSYPVGALSNKDAFSLLGVPDACW